MTESLRASLPPIPARMQRRPIDHRGYPVPWFVSQVNGTWEFRAIDARKIVQAMRERRCWVCGDLLGRFGAFVIGPMCAINRVSSEPPSHRDCAVFSAQACPFLTLPRAKRRAANLPEGVTAPAGMMIKRNPGVTLVWITRSWRPFNAGNGVLFRIGNPHETLWYAEGRAATRAEVQASIDSGLPILLQVAEEEGEVAVAELRRCQAEAAALLPAA